MPAAGEAGAGREATAAYMLRGGGDLHNQELVNAFQPILILPTLGCSLNHQLLVNLFNHSGIVNPKLC